LFLVGIVLRKNRYTEKYTRNPEALIGSEKEAIFFSDLTEMLVTLIIDLNYEVKAKGDAFDYKSDLKSPKQTEEWGDKLIQSYEKDVARNKAQDFTNLA
jgi:hypothetical protein